MLLKDDGYVCKVDMNNIVHNCQQCGNQLNIYVHVHETGQIEKKVTSREPKPVQTPKRSTSSIKKGGGAQETHLNTRANR